MRLTQALPAGTPVIYAGRPAEIVEDLGDGFYRIRDLTPDAGTDGEQHLTTIDDLYLPAAAPAQVNPVVSDHIADMPEAVLDGRLGEICLKRLNNFPIAYGWPALVSAAGAMMPVSAPVSNTMVGEQMTNFFTGLIGPVHSGKSQAILWANAVIGLPPIQYAPIKAASSEALLRKLHSMHKQGALLKSLLIDLDEWKFLFDKAGIEHASFATFLQTAFYKRSQSVVLGGGFEVALDCALTFIGGIVQDQFDECFGARAMGGLHDRFMFGLCPENYNFLYEPFQGAPEAIAPSTVSIAGDIWEFLSGLRKTNPHIGREEEIAIRVAHVCAAFDGRPILRAKDCERSVTAFIAEQTKIRDFLKPNEGATNDAVVANALLEWMNRNAPNGEITPERKVQNGLRRVLSKLGPGALSFATRNLQRKGLIIYGDIPNSRPYGGRKPKAYQLPFKPLSTPHE